MKTEDKKYYSTMIGCILVGILLFCIFSYWIFGVISSQPLMVRDANSMKMVSGNGPLLFGLYVGMFLIVCYLVYMGLDEIYAHYRNTKERLIN